MITTLPTPDPAELGERGRLTISDGTVERIAARAVTEIDGVGCTAEVTAKVSGGVATLHVRLSVSYPASVGRTTENARAHLMRRVEELAGLAVPCGHHRHRTARRGQRNQEGPVKRRPRRSTPATLTAVVLLAACAFVAVIAIQMILEQTPWVSYQSVADAVHNTHWNDLVPAIAGGGAALLGFILLLTAILPGKRTVLPLEGELDSGASRCSYRSTLRAAASAVDGVSGAKLKLKGRKAVVKVSTDRTNTDGIADAVRDAISHRLDQITPVIRPDVKVKVHAARSAS
ncbi:DUF6286 domain-containing Asp23/Gls24 family envelope stress response protein [Lentzea sp. HUAS TT2]|uniref:DUF6286 domain-containing Asp23/Gls24 family envelope stress response protein n=1 Tax=Lentzea sp. HUAS TT2 TaxID=3447454 RepID=UPI003F6F67E5